MPDQDGLHGRNPLRRDIMKRVRGQKGPEEVSGAERTVQAAMGVYEKARGSIRSGLSCGDIRAFFREEVRALGGEFSGLPTAIPMYPSARSSYLCKRLPADVYLAPGDSANVDFGLRLDGFGSDIQRSYYALGEDETMVSSEVQRAFEAVQAAIRAAVDAAKPGVHTTFPRDATSSVHLRKKFGW